MIVRWYFENSYSGCNQEEMMYYDNNTPKEDIDADVDDWGRENAESFAHVHFGWDEEYTEDEFDDYLYSCGWGWEEVSWDEYLEYCENWGLEPNPLWKK